MHILRWFLDAWNLIVSDWPTNQPTEIETQRATFAGKTNMYHSNSVFFFIERQTERPTDWKADTEMYSSDYQPLKDSIIFL